MSNLIKNEDGSFTYPDVHGDVTILAPVYNQELKKHVFNILRTGSVPAIHYGNHITFRNAIKGIVEGMTRPEETAPVEAVEAPSEAPETTERETTDPLLLALRKLVASKSDEDYAIFKTLLDEEVQSFS